MLLVYIRHLYSLSYFKLSFIYCLQSHNQTEQCRFSRTIGTDHTNNTIRRKHKVQIVKQQFIAVCFSHLFRFNDFITQTRTIRNEDFKFFFFLFHVFIQQLVIRVKTCLTLCLTGFGSHAHPFQLTFQCFATFADGLFFHFHTFCLLFQPGRVVTFPGNTFTTV